MCVYNLLILRQIICMLMNSMLMLMKYKLSVNSFRASRYVQKLSTKTTTSKFKIDKQRCKLPLFYVYAYVSIVYAWYFLMFWMIFIWFFRKIMDFPSAFYWNHYLISEFLNVFTCIYVICSKILTLYLYHFQFLDNYLCFFIVLLCNSTSIFTFNLLEWYSDIFDIVW